MVRIIDKNECFQCDISEVNWCPISLSSRAPFFTSYLVSSTISFLSKFLLAGFMAYQDLYRLSVHAVILDESNSALFVKKTYGAMTWTLPGGAVDPGETIHETLIRECREELGREIEVLYLSGVYFHSNHNSHAFVFLCKFVDDLSITLSEAHNMKLIDLMKKSRLDNMQDLHFVMENSASLKKRRGIAIQNRLK